MKKPWKSRKKCENPEERLTLKNYLYKTSNWQILPFTPGERPIESRRAGVDRVGLEGLDYFCLSLYGGGVSPLRKVSMGGRATVNNRNLLFRQGDQ